MKTSEELRRAKALIENVDNWCLYTLAMSSDGRECQPTDMCASRWCALGAAIRIEPHCEQSIDFLWAAAHTSGHDSPSHLNDYAGHSAVMRMYDAAISMALADEEPINETE